MKKLLRNLSVLCFVLAAFLTTGCYEEELPFLKADHEVVLVGPETGKGTVVIESNLQWTATSDVEWITVDNGFGNHKGTFEFFVAANTTPNERSGKITITSNDGVTSTTVLVRQQSEGTILTLGTDEVSFTKYAGEYLMSIACNGHWEAASSADWCKVDPASGDGNGSFKITVEENNTGADRVAIISVLTEADGKTEVHQIKVFQSASNAALVVSPESQTLTAAASQFVLDVITVGTWEASVDADWLTLSATEGTGDAKITASATANETGRERIAIITFATGAENENRVIRQIVVRQAAVDFYLDVPVTDYPLSVEAQTIEIPYVLEGSNVTVTASSSSKWMTVESVADGVCVVNVAENTTAIAREGVISFITHGQAGDPIIRQVRVAQAPTINLLDVLADEYAVEWVGETFRIPIYSNTPVTARSSETWCAVTVEGQNVVITVAKNETSYPRTAVVTATTDSDKGEILSKTTIIRQAAAYSELVVSPAEKNLYAIAQSFVANIVTNNSWTAQSDSDWLTIDKAEGTGDYMLNVNVAKNETGQVRVGVITVQTGIENSQRESATIVVTQRPEQFYFEVPTRSYLLDKWGAAIAIPYVTSGNEVSVVASSNVDWIRVDEVEDGAANVQVYENKTAEPRTGIVTITCTPVFGDPIAIPVTFTQSPTVNILDVFVDVIDASARGDEFALPYYANTPVSVSSSEDWIHAMVTEDEDSYDPEGCCSYSEKQKIIKIEVDPNRTGEARVGYVTIATVSDSGEHLTHVITIRQAALYAALSVTPKEVVLPAHMGHFNMTVNTTGTWWATNSCTWLTNEVDGGFSTEAAGFGDGEVFWEAGVNDTGATREAWITVATGPENNEREEQVVHVIQYHRDTYIEIPIAAYAISKEQQTLAVGYYAAGDFKDMQVNCSEDWIVYNAGNSDDATLSFDIAENTTAEPRTAVVTVTLDLVAGEPISDTFIVTQAPTINILDAYVSAVEASPQGQRFILPFYTNTTVNAVSSDDRWCHVIVNPDTDPGDLVILVDRNEDAEARTAYVTLTTVTDKGEKLTHIITVHQNPLNAMLTVSPEVVYMPAHDAEFYMTIVTTGTWALDMDADTWCMPYSDDDWEGEGDASIYFVLEDNFTGADRETTIIVWTGTENENRVEKYVKVIQLARDTYLEIPQESFFVAKEGFSGLDGQYFEVACIIAGDVKDVVVDCSESWIKFVDGEPNYLDFIVMPNDTGAPRTATVTVTIDKVQGEPVTDTFTVTQAGTYNILEGLSDKVVADAAGEEFTLPVITNVEDLSVVVSEPTWITVDPVTVENGYASVHFAVAANTTGKDRHASLTIITTSNKGETLEKKIMVYQPAADTYFAILSGENVLVTKAQSDITVTAYANVNADKVTMISNAPWISVKTEPAVGTDPQIVEGVFTIAENTTGARRQGEIIVTFFDEKGDTVQKTIVVNQAATDGGELAALVDFITVAAAGETVVLTFETEDPLTATPSASWISSATIDNTADPQTLTIVAAENTTGMDRTAYITVSNGSESVIITVFQPAKDTHFAIISADDIYISSEQQNIDILAYASVNQDAIEAESSHPWLAKTNISASGTQVTATFAAEKNESPEPRVATVKFTFTEESGATVEKFVNVHQAAADQDILEALVDYIVLDPKRPETKTLEFISNKDVTATSSSDWCSASATGTTVAISGDENNTGYDRTAYVTVSNGNLKKVVTVFQPAKTTDLAVITPDIVHITSAAQSISIIAVDGANADKLQMNTQNADEDWLTPNGPLSLSGEYIVTGTFDAAENTSTEARTATVRVASVDLVGNIITKDVTIIQAGAEQDVLEAMVEYLVFDSHAYTAAEGQTLTFIANGDLTSATSSAAWLKAEKDGKNVTIYPATENATGAERIAYVTVTKGSKSALVTVVQLPAAPADKALTLLSPDILHIAAAANDNVSIKLLNTVNPDVTVAFSDSDWLTKLTGPQHLGSNVVNTVFKATENTATEPRTAIVKFTTQDENGKPYQVEAIVIQAGAADDSILEALVDYVVVSAAGENVTIGFNAKENISAAISSSTWLGASFDAATNTVTLTAQPNTTGADRTAYVTVKNSTKTASVTVFQPAAETTFAVLSPDIMHIEATSASVDIAAFGSDVDDASAITMISDASWLTAGTPALSGKNVTTTFTAADNTAAEAREASVKITYTDKSGKVQTANVLVIQAGAADDSILEALVDFVSMNPAGETMKIGFLTSEALSSAQSSSAWLTVTPGTEIIKLEAAANTTGYDRTAYVTVKTSDKTALVTVFQAAAATEFVVLTPNRAITSAAQTVPLRVYSSQEIADVADVKCSPTEPWISVEPKTLSADKHIVSIPVKATLNDTGDARMANLDITLVENGKTYAGVATITQSPSENILDVYVSTMLVPYLATEDLLPVYSNATSLVPRSSNTSWLGVALSVDASGNKDVKITIAKNETGETRTGYVTLTAKFADGTTEEKVITVVQTPEGSSASVPDYIYLALSDVTLPMAGGTKSVEVFASPGTDYTVSSSAAWLTATKGSVKLEAEPNTTGVDRTATVTVVATFPNGETETKTMSVTQKGTDDGTVANYLNLLPRIEFTSNYNAGWTYPLNTNGTSVSDINLSFGAVTDWVTVTADGTTLTITPQINTASQNRTAELTFKVHFEDGSVEPANILIQQAGLVGGDEYLSVVDEINVKANGKLAGGAEPKIDVFTNLTGVTYELFEPGGNTDWVTVTKASDKLFNLTVAENTTTEVRKLQVILKATGVQGEKTATVSIVQGVGNEDENFFEMYDSIIIDRTYSQKMTLCTNAVSFTAEPATPCDWLYLDPQIYENNSLVLLIEGVNNVYYTTTENVRVNVTVTFADGSTETKQLGVDRRPDETLYVDVPETVHYQYTETSLELIVNTNGKIDDSTIIIPDAATWLTVQEAGVGKIIFRAQQNNGTKRKIPVSFDVTLHGQTISKEVMIEQLGSPEMDSSDITFDPAILEFPATISTATLTINDGKSPSIDGDLEVECIGVDGAGWIEAIVEEGHNPHIITVTVKANENNPKERAGFIHVTTTGSGSHKEAYIPVKQAAASNYFVLLADEVYANNYATYVYVPFDYKGSSELNISDLTFSGIATGTNAGSSNWIYGISASHTDWRPTIVGGKTIRFRLTANGNASFGQEPSGAARSKIVTIKYSDLAQSVTIHQQRN